MIDKIDFKKLTANFQDKTYDDCFQIMAETVVNKMNEIVEDYNGSKKEK